ncbi:MAG: integrin alpha [Isosphaeraceae bacterium]
MGRRRERTWMDSPGSSNSVHPAVEALEARIVLATTIDSANIAGPNPPATGAGPYGVQLLQGAGRDVAVLRSTIGATANDDYLTTGPGAAYLVFGSRAVVPNFPAGTPANTSQNYLRLNYLQRTGTITNVGNATQNNPILNQAGFPYEGIRIVDSSPGGDTSNVFVAPVGDIDRASAGDGFQDFLVGFPGLSRAYLIYGSPNLLQVPNKTLDLNNLPNNLNLRVVRFNGTSGSRAGASVAGLQNFLRDGSNDIVIGAPSATVGLTGSQVGNGAVYVITAGYINGIAAPNRVVSVNLSAVGQTGTGGVAGVVFTGEGDFSGAGFSVAPAGDFDGTTNAVGAQDDLLIGAPNDGTAYVIYSSANLPAQQQALPGGSIGISLSRVGAANDVAGAAFIFGSDTGYSVSTAGDFDNDGVSDILIGNPSFDFLSGRAFLIFGRRATTTTPAINGRFNGVNNLPAGTRSITYVGGAFQQLGTSVSGLGRLAGTQVVNGRRSQDNLDDIAIGAPGTPLLASGTVYVMLGKTTLPTSPAPADTEADLIITGATGFGRAVAARRFPLNPVSTTIDSDRIPDFVVGGVRGPSPASGNATFVFEGALLFPNQSSTGGTVLPGRGASAPVATQLILPEQAVPTVQSLSTFLYKAIPSTVALPEFRPKAANATRLARFQGLVKTSKKNGTKYYNQPSRGNTLGYGVFSRGRYPVGQVRFKAVPTNSKTVPVNLNR